MATKTTFIGIYTLRMRSNFSFLWFIYIGDFLKVEKGRIFIYLDTFVSFLGKKIDETVLLT